MTTYTASRPGEGISLNAELRDTLLNEDGSVMTFTSAQGALHYLLEHSTLEELREAGVTIHGSDGSVSQV